MKTKLNEQQLAIVRGWHNVAIEHGADVREVVRIAVMLVGSSIVGVARNREDALEGVAALTRDITRHIDEKFGKSS